MSAAPEPVDRLVACRPRPRRCGARAASSRASAFCAALVSWYSSTSTWREPLLVAAPGPREAREQANRQQQQVVEVHGVGCEQTRCWYEVVDVGDAPARRWCAALPLGTRPGRCSRTWPGDLPRAPSGRGIFLVSMSSSFRQMLHQTTGVGVVVDGERAHVARGGHRGPAGSARRPSGRWRPTYAAPRGRSALTTRSRISSAALLVKVMARICHGGASPVAIRWAIRRVRTRVFPDPAPGHDQQRPARWSTARRCGSVSPSKTRPARDPVAPVGPTPRPARPCGPHRCGGLCGPCGPGALGRPRRSANSSSRSPNSPRSPKR